MPATGVVAKIPDCTDDGDSEDADGDINDGGSDDDDDGPCTWVCQNCWYQTPRLYQCLLPTIVIYS